MYEGHNVFSDCSTGYILGGDVSSRSVAAHIVNSHGVIRYFLYPTKGYFLSGGRAVSQNIHEPKYLQVARWCFQQRKPLRISDIASGMNLPIRDVYNATAYILRLTDWIQACWIKDTDGEEELDKPRLFLVSHISEPIVGRLKRRRISDAGAKRYVSYPNPPNNLSLEEKWQWLVGHRNKVNDNK